MNSTLLFISIKVAFIALLLFVFAGVALRVANATTRVDTVTHVRDGDTIEVRTVRGRSMGSLPTKVPILSQGSLRDSTCNRASLII